MLTPNPEFSGKRLGVTFVDGEARTQYLEKAKEFSEVFGYEVVPFTGAPTWEEIPDPMVSAGEHAPWAEEESHRKLPAETPLNRPEGQLKPRRVKDEIAEDKAFSRAVPNV